MKYCKGNADVLLMSIWAGQSQKGLVKSPGYGYSPIPEWVWGGGKPTPSSSSSPVVQSGFLHDSCCNCFKLQKMPKKKKGFCMLFQMGFYLGEGRRPGDDKEQSAILRAGINCCILLRSTDLQSFSVTALWFSMVFPNLRSTSTPEGCRTTAQGLFPEFCSINQSIP